MADAEIKDLPRIADMIEEISDPSQILHILDRLRQDRSLLTVLIPGAPTTYATTILAIDPARNEMILDEITPKTGHLRFLQEKRLTAEGKINGIAVRFRTTLLSVGEDRGIAFYRVAIPAFITYRQRRAYFRLDVSHGYDIRVTLEVREEQPPLPGRLHDISIGGMGICFHIDLDQVDVDRVLALKPGQLLRGYIPEFPDGKPLSALLEVRHVRLDKVRRMVRLGARFTKLDREQERRVRQFVIERQRELLKTLHLLSPR